MGEVRVKKLVESAREEAVVGNDSDSSASSRVGTVVEAEAAARTCADLASGGSCRRRHRCHSPRGVPASPTPTHVPVTPTPTRSRACRWQAPPAGPVTSAGPDLVSSTRRPAGQPSTRPGPGPGPGPADADRSQPHNGPFYPNNGFRGTVTYFLLRRADVRARFLRVPRAGGAARPAHQVIAGHGITPPPPADHHQHHKNTDVTATITNTCCFDSGRRASLGSA